MTQAIQPGQRVVLDLTVQPELPSDHSTLKTFAAQFEVRDDESYAIAAEMIQKSARWNANVEAFFDKGRAQAHAAHKWFTDTIKKLTAPYDVRSILEPKMLRYRQEQERAKREAEERIRREQEAAERAAREEAARIQAEADAKARELRRQGDIAAAREMQQNAQQSAQTVIAEAESSVGVILPDTRPNVGFLGESRPWTGVVDDPMELIRAVANGKVPLMYTTKTGAEPIVAVNQRIVTEIAKRLGKEDIGLPGCRGERGLSLRVSTGGSRREEPEW